MYYFSIGTIRHLSPEFDQVLKIILSTDAQAIILLAVVRSGRDNLPVMHRAVRHDMMHPAMPIAAVTKLKQRWRLHAHMGGDMTE